MLLSTIGRSCFSLRRLCTRAGQERTVTAISNYHRRRREERKVVTAFPSHTPFSLALKVKEKVSIFPFRLSRLGESGLRKFKGERRWAEDVRERTARTNEKVPGVCVKVDCGLQSLEGCQQLKVHFWLQPAGVLARSRERLELSQTTRLLRVCL